MSKDFETYELFIRKLGTIKSILDVGCGKGRLLHYIARKFPEAIAVGIDVSISNLMKARETPSSAEFVLSDASELPFAHEQFECVTAINVLHEVFSFKGPDSLHKTLQEIHRVLKNSGNFIILDMCIPEPERDYVLRMPENSIEKLKFFALNFKPSKVTYRIKGRNIIMNSKDFINFVSKLGNGIRNPIELKELHAWIKLSEFRDLLERLGFIVISSYRFGKEMIKQKLANEGIELIEGDAPNYKFIVKASRSS